MPELRVLPLDQIDGPALELRADRPDARLLELAESIRAVGLLQPIGVAAVGERYRLVFGKGRYLAHRWAGLASIEAKVFSADEAAELDASMAENVVRADLTPVEEARAVRQMMDRHGRSVRQVASALGKSESWVRGRMELLLWPVEVVGVVARGELSVAVGRELVLVEDEGMRAHFLKCAVENGITAQQARLWRQEWEASRAFGAVVGDGAAAAPSLPPAPVPVVLCNVCDQVAPVTAITFVRACPGCATELARAKAAR